MNIMIQLNSSLTLAQIAVGSGRAAYETGQAVAAVLSVLIAVLASFPLASALARRSVLGPNSN